MSGSGGESESPGSKRRGPTCRSLPVPTHSERQRLAQHRSQAMERREIASLKFKAKESNRESGGSGAEVAGGALTRLCTHPQ